MPLILRLMGRLEETAAEIEEGSLEIVADLELLAVVVEDEFEVVVEVIVEIVMLLVIGNKFFLPLAGAMEDTLVVVLAVGAAKKATKDLALILTMPRN